MFTAPFLFNLGRIFLLAYSPLAMGILSGKYFAGDGGPENARLNLFRGISSTSSYDFMETFKRILIICFIG